MVTAGRAVLCGAGMTALLAAQLLAAAGSAVAAPSAPAAQVAEIRATGDDVRFVLTASGLPAGSTLDPASTQVTLDGKPVVARASRTRGAGPAPAGLPPRSVLVVLDTSGSMTTDLVVARQAALDFARQLPADVRVGLVTFADRPRLVLRPTPDRAAMATALASARAGGGTALYDAVLTGLTALDPARAPKGSVLRLVVLSDGLDTTSRATLAATLARVRAAGVPVDVVAFRISDDLAALRQLAATGGGRVLPATDPRGLAAAFSAAAGGIDQRLDVVVSVPEGLAGRRVRLEARVTAGAQVLRAGGDVTLPAGAATPASTAFTVAGWVAAGGWRLRALAALVFVSLLALGLLATVLAAGPSQRERRLAQLGIYTLSAGRPRSAGGMRSPVARAVLGWTERLISARGIQQKVALELDRAGMNLRVQEWMLLRTCGCAVLAAVLVVMLRSPLLGVPAGIALGWIGTRMFVSIRASRRCAAFGSRLPDLLQLVAGSLKSGFSLTQALDSVVRDGSQPVAGEVSRALAETRLGVALEDGLDAVAARMRSGDLSWTVMAIRIQRTVGGNLADVLLTTAQTMRERAQVHRQVRALTAEGRLSAYILVALPVGVGGLLFMTKPDYMRPLITERIGIVMLVVAGLLVLVGGFWMSRLIKVEV